MLDNRIAQAGVMVGVMGLLFGMVLAPIPNVASEYVLQGILGDMTFHYGRHQAAFEAYQITASPSNPNYLVEDYVIQTAVDNPSDCENSRGDYFQFERSVLDDGNCVETPDTAYTYGYYGTGAAYQQEITDTPPRISFYVRDDGPNSMNLELSEQTLNTLPFYQED
ncbi:hypothetical protein ACK3SF_00555 [Candidatus Nanosalina sp. VS9-1]|uniref:hypothetical protein n=1 Tax=Candidatus Nanosalina sp. VS9-1 TaxID=3388566 RepID=UPI0039E1136C